MPGHRFHGDRTQTRTGGRYDGRHKRARADAARRHHDHHPCARCGLPLGPMGKWLHYDHTDDGTGYLGFAHAHCNTSAGARKGNTIYGAYTAGRASRVPAPARTPQPVSYKIIHTMSDMGGNP